jgi:Putative ER transporter, 6TM, N-terminal
MSIFGTIAIDIFFVRHSNIHRLFLIPPQTIGPLFPFTQYNILNSLLIPVSIYLAIAVVVTIFIFPRTAHHAFLGTVTLLLGQMKVLLDAQEDLLTSAPGSIPPGSPKALQWGATRVSMFTIHQGRTFVLLCVIITA